jgi:hypothetical protein
MMRNVALGAVIGFGFMVLLLSILGREAPPRLPPPAPEPAAVVPDAGTPPRPPPPAAPAAVPSNDGGPVAVAPTLAPFNVPVIHTPMRLNVGQLELSRAHQRLMQQPAARLPDAGP